MTGADANRSPDGGSAFGELRRSIVFDLLAILLLVLIAYFVRLEEIPILGEEGRRARGAINMIESGDWIVVRNQGAVFPDRPPMTNWLIALGGLARGGVDVAAIRLPSALAVLFTAVLLYGYGRRVGTAGEGLMAAAVFVTFGEVLQLGRLGESEAVFVLFVSASLLVWHVGFSTGWSPTLTWSAGYALAALGALTKGLQAPVYFVGVTALFLIWRRERRWLLGRGHWVGAAVFLTIVLAWQIPYYLATDWPSVAGSWFAVVGPRLRPDRLAVHLATYPLEILGALLPWSPLLLLLGSRRIRRRLFSRLPARKLPRQESQWTFLLASLAATFPTVWISAGARTRYYMPLYPLIAVSIAMILARAVAGADGGQSAGIRRRALSAIAVAVLFLSSIVVAVLWVETPQVADLRPSAGWAVAILLAGALVSGAALRARSTSGRPTLPTVVLLAALFIGALHSGSVVGQLAGRRQDVGPAVAALRARVPRPEKLVSFGPVHTKFLYFWGDLVPEIPWPRALDDLPPEVDYFSFDMRPSPTPGSRLATRGMVVWTTPTTLPFQWRKVGAVDCGRKPMNPPDAEVVVGQVVRDVDGRPLPADE